VLAKDRAVLNEPPSDEQKYNEQKHIALGLFLQGLRQDPNSVPAMAGTAAMYTWLDVRAQRLNEAIFCSAGGCL
jgi:hypothetical protein